MLASDARLAHLRESTQETGNGVLEGWVPTEQAQMVEDAIDEFSQQVGEGLQVQATNHATTLRKWAQRDLVALCKLNKVPHSGRKDEQIKRILRYDAFGLLPTCPKCSKAQLKWEVRAGHARPRCPGYYAQGMVQKCNGPLQDVDVRPWSWGDKVNLLGKSCIDRGEERGHDRGEACDIALSPNVSALAKRLASKATVSAVAAGSSEATVSAVRGPTKASSASPAGALEKSWEAEAEVAEPQVVVDEHVETRPAAHAAVASSSEATVSDVHAPIQASSLSPAGAHEKSWEAEAEVAEPQVVVDEHEETRPATHADLQSKAKRAHAAASTTTPAGAHLDGESGGASPTEAMSDAVGRVAPVHPEPTAAAIKKRSMPASARPAQREWKKRHIQKASKTYLLREPLKKAVHEALRVTHNAEEDGRVCPRFSAAAVCDLVVSAEKMIEILLQEWERMNNGRKKPLASMTASGLREAMAVVLGSWEAAADESRLANVVNDIELGKYFTKRALRMIVVRTTERVYDIHDEALLELQRLLWGRVLACASGLLAIHSGSRKFVTREDLKFVLALPRPQGWGIRVLPVP
eukprot:TRINITY_DN2158_c0_g1_i5.p1 TRINITY_DN2158_c0_g1~~TRINITY_DN2158_c0_g1_i5.p1  ORF type:complete len:580 (+),score=110.56 TRINITY_DN2158_c0_g1_i5:50-1789(+)